MKVRQAKPTDAFELLEIYRPSIESSVTSFEMAPPSVEEFAGRIAVAIERHDWLVLEDAGVLCGYAYATPHRARQAYQHSVETSVYVHADHYGKGIGKRLYVALFEALQPLGFHNAYAGITLPNAASIALHQSLGFESIGVFREVGYKYGAWHDVAWLQRRVSPPPLVSHPPGSTVHRNSESDHE